MYPNGQPTSNTSLFQVEGYPYIAVGDTFPALSGGNRTFFRWDGVNTTPSIVTANQPPSYFFWAESRLVSGQWRTFIACSFNENYNGVDIGVRAAADDYLETFKVKFPVTTDKRVAPQLFATPDRRHFFAWHLASRSYRLFYSATPLPVNQEFNVQVNTQIIFLDRTQSSADPAGFDTGDIRQRLVAKPGWGTWAYDNRYHPTGIRPDLPDSLIEWGSGDIKTKYNVGEYGGAATFQISESQLPAHNHMGVGDEVAAAVGILGSSGLYKNFAINDSDNRGIMMGTTFNGSNSPISVETPYYALAYIMYVGF